MKALKYKRMAFQKIWTMNKGKQVIIQIIHSNNLLRCSFLCKLVEEHKAYVMDRGLTSENP